MAQALPSTLAYAQAIELIDRLRKEYAQSKFQTSDEVSAIIKEVITRFDAGVGFALTDFEPLEKGEPPHSEVINRFYSNIKSDINILQDQVDLLRAAALFSYNFQKTEIMKSKLANSRLQNKLKTLEMYSQTNDSTLIKLGDVFQNDEFIDWDLTDTSERAVILSPGYVSLGVDEQKSDLLKSAVVNIMSTSNGFLGNNQEAYQTTVKDPITNQPLIRFVAEDNRASDLLALIDSEPNTWMEYEHYSISDSDRAKADNLNFQYKTSTSGTTVLVNTGNSGVVDWAKGPADNVLSLELEIDLAQAKKINVVTFTPFGLPDNKNNPIKVVSVKISETGTDWDLLTPDNLWIVNAIDKKLSITGTENATVGSATWVTNGTYTRYIRFRLEQPNPIMAQIGHVYYIKDTIASVPTTSATTTTPVEQRVLGPNPPIENPAYYYDPRNFSVSGTAQKREIFTGKRWAIGIRDIDVRSNVYKSEGVIVSKQFNIPGLIDRVAIEADIFMPSTFSQSEPWIRFYISPNEGANWYQISRIQDDYLDIPEILAFNDPTPQALREPGISYIDIPNLKVNSLRVKIELSRPSTEDDATPVLKSYMLKIKRRA